MTDKITIWEGINWGTDGANYDGKSDNLPLVTVEIDGYHVDSTVSLMVWGKSGNDDELLFDWPLEAEDLRYLAAWANNVAEAIENREDFDFHAKERNSAPWNGHRAWKDKGNAP